MGTRLRLDMFHCKELVGFIQQDLPADICS
jgi:hypothetical protein